MNVVTQSNLIDRITSEELSQDALYKLRLEAKEAFGKQGLPHSKTEEYKFTPLTRYLEKSFESFSSDSKNTLTSIDPYRIKGLDAYELVFVNGEFIESLSSFASTDLEITSIRTALEQNSEILNQLGELADASRDPFLAWNTAYFTDGVVISIADQVRLSKPIVLYHISDTQNQKSVAINRNLIFLGNGSEVSVIEKHDSIGNDVSFINHVNEIIVKEDAGLTYSCIQKNSTGIQFNHTNIHQASNSRVNCFTITLEGRAVRNNLHLAIDGEGCDSHMYGLYLLTGETLADNHTVVDHKKPNSQSNELYKGVMSESSKGVFNGKIFVRPQAQKTNAFQSNRNIILSDKATVNTKPQLEIWADDVKCSHGCTSGQLDDEALFYLQTRGIDRDKAQALLLDAFAGEVVEKIENAVLRKYVEELVNVQLHERF
ncbi:MAG: Fe-S cluster assembly protein SufD [Flammeovirgaceae bacterium]|nr:Fe-S cluster assembly protein SufD [Flammeovirgaceae bacterium]